MLHSSAVNGKVLFVCIHLSTQRTFIFLEHQNCVNKLHTNETVIIWITKSDRLETMEYMYENLE